MNRWVGILVALACLLGASAAAASWNGSGSGSGYSKAQSLSAGNAPTTSVSGRNVTVNWTAPSGGAPVTGYTVKRYSTGGVVQTIGSNCTGTISGLTCTEQNVPSGSWTYSVTPRRGNWSGAESPRSAAATVGTPTLQLSGSTTLTTLPGTLSGSISNYKSGQTVTFRLDNATTGQVLSGSITPSPTPSNGQASVSVTIPAGTSEGAHTLYAIGSAGDVASAAFNVNSLDRFEIDTISQQHDGRSFTITVTARDSAGATVTGYSGSVSLSTDSGSISPTQSGSFSNGVLTQQVTITGDYNANQSITVTGSGKTATSNSFTLNDWQYYFKKTTGSTGTNCAPGTRLRDMEQGYTGADPEELFSRATGGATHLRFCSPTFGAAETLGAGTTTIEAWTTNIAGSSCAISATVYKHSGGVATSLGSTSLTIPNNSATTLRTWTISTSGTTFAAGDRLNVSFVQQDVKACDSTDIHYGGTTRRSNVQFPGPA